MLSPLHLIAQLLYVNFIIQSHASAQPVVSEHIVRLVTCTLGKSDLHVFTSQYKYTPIITQYIMTCSIYSLSFNHFSYYTLPLSPP
jgi:hypothetical protein